MGILNRERRPMKSTFAIAADLDKVVELRDRFVAQTRLREWDAGKRPWFRRTSVRVAPVKLASRLCLMSTCRARNNRSIGAALLPQLAIDVQVLKWEGRWRENPD